MEYALPGEDLVQQGVADLSDHKETVASLLVCVGATRLRRIGIHLPDDLPPYPEHRLYDLLALDDQDTAHSRYNALIRKLVGFEQAAECVKK